MELPNCYGHVLTPVLIVLLGEVLSILCLGNHFPQWITAILSSSVASQVQQPHTDCEVRKSGQEERAFSFEV